MSSSTSNMFVVVESDAVEAFFERGWTDGLPVVSPTAGRVEAMLRAGGVEPGVVVGVVPERRRVVTAEKAAVNAVMAGCLPEYFPVVLAVLGAVFDPAFNANLVFTSTGGAAVCVVVSGPLGREVGMNARHNALGSGNRANATIGRAVRLVAINVLGSRTGGFDATAMGNPGKYALCFLEDEPLAPWEPLRVTLGYGLEDTTVTVLPAEAPRQVANHLNEDPVGVLSTFASIMRAPGTFIVGKSGQGVVVMGPEHAAAVRNGGWSKEQAREFLVRETRVTAAELAGAGVVVEREAVPGGDGAFATFDEPDDLLIVTAGGEGAGWSAYIPGFSPTKHCRMVTRRVALAGASLPDCGPDACQVDLPPVLSFSEGSPR